VARVLCLDCDNPFGPSPGGQSVFTRDMVLSLADPLNITLATLGPVKESHDQHVTYESVVAGGHSTRRDMAAFALKGRRYVQHQSGYDAVVEQFTSPIGPLGLPTATHAPVIGVACFSFWDEMSAKYHVPFNRIARHRLVHYRWLIANHVSVAERLRQLAPQAEVLVIEQLVMDGPETLPAEPGTTALFLGRADWHQKGIDMLIGALELVDIPGLVVEIAGFDASDPSWLRFARNKKFRCEIRFLSYVSGAEKAAAFERARVVLVPSRYEGPGYVVLEAANYGVPSVAFDLPCFSDRRDVMFLADDMSARSFADALERAWSDEASYDAIRARCIASAAKNKGSGQVENFHRFVARVMATGLKSEDK
jgi:glycosyltransferase involved in cell wall biosynthesis